ncbi:hypothetical protein QSV08_00620 [Maribacter sp. BPC-D8]|uniref:hypothetical protein n=1 Tax=Maribacter sp. BPC-D8 TaxID=3053613 RepID=UPI002B48D66F|nr:hypothetical protein [Maribacter sp. BPC-D8]WRI29756.1 hypothetical protein QSV08_00620 [Maribacter sp. BPC-D8]
MIFKKQLWLFLFSIFILTTSFKVDHSIVTADNTYSSERMPTMVEMLQHGEHYTIQITSIGCFHGKRQTITILNKEGILTASLNNKRKILSPSDVNELIHFELQLREIPLGACTTIDTYSISNDYETFTTSDGTCSWQGYKSLLAIF